jgi:hypothetical protein
MSRNENLSSLIDIPGPRIPSKADILGHCMHFGTDAIVNPLGSKWGISFGEWSHPGVFETKAEAVRAASRFLAS